MPLHMPSYWNDEDDLIEFSMTYELCNWGYMGQTDFSRKLSFFSASDGFKQEQFFDPYFGRMLDERAFFNLNDLRPRPNATIIFPLHCHIYPGDLILCKEQKGRYVNGYQRLSSYGIIVHIGAPTYNAYTRTESIPIGILWQFGKHDEFIMGG